MKSMPRACAIFVVISSFLGFAAEDAIQPLQIGAAAPEFNLPGVDGKHYTLKDFADSRILAIIFTCNHCPTAQAYEDRIMRLVSDYRPKGVAFLAISPNDPRAVRLDELGYSDLNDSFPEMKIRAAGKKYNFPYVYDGETQITSTAYGPTATPHVFVFDAERKLRYQGRVDNSENGRSITSADFRNALDALLAGREVPVKTTRPFGCSIKWAGKGDSVKRALEKWAAEEVTVRAIDAPGLRELAANKTEKYRLINVWATWCGPCIVEFPELVTINRMYRGRPFEFVSVSADDPERGGEVLAFLKRQQASNLNTHFSSPDKDALADALDPKWNGALPHTILVKPGGGIVFRHTGELDPLELKRVIVGYLGRTYQ